MAPLAALIPAATASTAAGMAAGSVAGVSAATATGGGLAAFAPSLSTLATAASLGGTALSAIGQYQAGKQAEAVGEANATMATQEAAARIEATKADTLKLSRAANRTMSEQTAAYGATGFAQEGTPLEVMVNTAREYERDILTTGYTGMVGAQEKLNEAEIYRWQGKQQRKASAWGAGTTLLTGFGNWGLSRMGFRNRGYI